MEEDIKYKEDYRRVSYDSMKSSRDIREQMLIRLFKVLFVILIIAIIVGIHGPFVINNFFGYPSSSNRLYELKINDRLVNVNSYYSFKVPIIPYVLYVDSNNDDDFFVNETYGAAEFDLNNKFNIELNTYECYYQNNRVRCRDFKDKTKKKKYHLKEISITKMKDDGESSVVYKGKYLKDISKYINEEAYYDINFYGSYGFTKFEVNTTIKVK